MAIVLTDIGGMVIPGTAYLETDAEGDYTVIAGLYGCNAYPEERIDLLLARTPCECVAELLVCLLNAGPAPNCESLEDMPDELSHCQKQKKRKHKHRQ